MYCCNPKEKSFIEQFNNSAATLMISQTERAYLNDRYIPLVEEAEAAACLRSWQFHVLVNFITVSSILITAFTSLETSIRVSESAQIGLYWTVVALGISLTIANKFLYVFGIHKKFILTQQIEQRYKTEGWMFLAGVDKYSDPIDKRFLIFCERVERIQAKQTQDMMVINAAAVSAMASAPLKVSQSDSPSTQETPRHHRTVLPPILTSVKVDKGKGVVPEGGPTTAASI
jgi:hypothetical protein